MLDGIPKSSVGFRQDGGPVIPDAEDKSFDFERLERAVVDLADAHRRLRGENVTLQRQMDEKNRRIRTLDGQILDANQRRRDVTKRVDELIAQIDQLESQLGSLEPE